MARKVGLFGGIALACIGVGCIVYALMFAAPDTTAHEAQFTVPIGTTDMQAVGMLKDKGFIKNTGAFDLARTLAGGGTIAPGGYSLSASMSVWRVVRVLSAGPTQIWVTIPEGLRKEEIAAILTKDLGWTNAQETEWITKDTAPDADHTEGVYFPDTYLIPLSETPADVAARMRAHFEEVFAPYAKEALTQNIKWTTTLKVASLVQREAAGTSDMPLIAGIIWNRLDKKMALDIDSTIQYARGDTGAGWWAPITVADKKVDSPYNTYLHVGLPPTPIDDPGLTAIDAALHPATTTCLYYLHDINKQIHCAPTLAEHEANIAKYLK